MAYTKKTNSKNVVIDETPDVTGEPINAKPEAKDTMPKIEDKPIFEPIVEKDYKGEDLIPCRSMTKGELIYIGKKTKEVYIWSDYGDVTEIEYQDLLALKVSKSKFIFDILFVIEDDNLLETSKWKEVKILYDKIYSEDIDTILAMNVDDFKKIFPTLPIGLKNAVKSEVATQMEAGTFDSMQKIKLIDEICGTDLNSLR